MKRRSVIPFAAVVSAAALAGCGSGSSTHTSIEGTVSSSTSAASASPTTTQAAPSAVPAALAKEPTIAKPSAPPPQKLVVRDLVKGTGPAAKSGQTLTVQYVGVSYATGKKFDASWDHGQPFPFQLGAGMVIPGWDQGLVGMKVGSRRQLIIPPQLAYGAQGSPPQIGPNETLIFDIDLLQAK